MATTDGSGNVTGTNELSPYGEVLSSNTSDSFSYAGLFQDTEYGGDAATYRNYTTEQLRWTRPDPYDGSYDLSNPQSFNRYMYVNGNPLGFVDPSGLDTQCVDNPGKPCTIVVKGTAPNCDDGRFCGPGYIAPWELCEVLNNYNCESIGYRGGSWGVASPFTGTTTPRPSAPNNGTPWYENSCVTGALKSGAIRVGIDALGFLPEAGGVARVVGHQAGYVGIVADNVGKNMLTAGTKTTGFLSSATGFSSSDWTTWVSGGITAADFVPIVSDFTTPAAMIWDAGVGAYKAYQCP